MTTACCVFLALTIACMAGCKKSSSTQDDSDGHVDSDVDDPDAGPPVDSSTQDPVDGSVVDPEPSGRIDYDESEYDSYVDTSLHYRFPLDEDGWAVIEPGQNHKTIYVSETGDDNNDGLSPDSPIATLSEARSRIQEGSSDWILLKRGDRFPGERFREELNGESPEHPVLIGSYGEGPRPVMEGALRLWATHSNVVVRDLHVEYVGKYCLDVLGTIENLFFENVVTEGCESRIQGSDDNMHVGVTLRRTMILDAHQAAPVNDAENWMDAHANRISGIYIAGTAGLLIDECYADFNGWRNGYDEDGGAGPHPPSMFSHNFYIQSNNTHVIYRGTISSRGASTGAQIRPGGVVQQNVFFANNVQFFTGGDHPSLVTDNAVTIAGNKRAHQIGALGWGYSAQDVQDTLVRRLMVFHSTDPLDPSPPNDAANSAIHNAAEATVEDLVVYKWGSSADQPEGWNPSEDPDGISIIAYATNSEIGASNLDEFDQILRSRDRGWWPYKLSGPAIVEYFQEVFTP